MQKSRQLPFGLGLRYNYTDYFERQRAIGMLYLMLTIALFVLILVAINIASIIANRANLGETNLGITLSILVTSLFITYLVQNGKIKLASRILVALSFAVVLMSHGSLALFSWGILNSLVLINAGLLLNRVSLLITSFLVIMNMVRVAFASLSSFEMVLASGYVTVFFIIVLTAIYFLLFMGLFEDAVRREVEGSEQMTAVGRFLRRIPRKDEDEAFVAVINFIRNDLNYNFAQVYLVDDDTGLLTTRIRTGLGVDLETVRTPTRVSDSNVLMQALRTKTSIFVSADESEFRHEHFLPSTKFGVAVPIIMRDAVVAVLDIQEAKGRFSRMKMRSLELLAEGMSIILEDGATVGALRQVLEDQSATLDNLRRQLREYKQYEKQVVGGVWDEYLQGRGYEAIGFNLDMSQLGNPVIVPSFDLPEDLAPTLETREVHVEVSADGNRIYVPIILRGEILGALRFILPPEKLPSERQLDLIQNVVDRLALALENKRLFEQSRSQAIRERKANEVARELIGATEVRDVLSLAAQMFTTALGAIHTHIQLQPDVMKMTSTLTGEVPHISSDNQSVGDTPDA